MEKTVHTLHFALADSGKPLMSYDDTKPYGEQKVALDVKYRELLGMPEKQTESKPILEYTSGDNPDFDEIRFRFESEPDFFVPAHILYPKGALGSETTKLPALICLQGHSTGMHISLGRPKYPGDDEDIAGDRDFAVKAVKRGYIAVAMELRGFGELKGDIRTPEDHTNCHLAATQALMLGRTLIGERAFDITRLIDALESFPEIDMARIGLMGNSGGGTATFYTACVEPRITAAMPSCSFCMNRRSIFAMRHCVCNFIPYMEKYFEMCDLTMLIAPRPLVIVAGKEDTGFPLAGVLEGFEVVKKIYARVGAPDNARLVVGQAGHRFYAPEGFAEFKDAAF